MDGSTTRTILGITSLLTALVVPFAAQASGARQGVQSRPGEIVLLRDVHARTAYRPAPPGVALIADPSPRREVGQALGTPTGMAELSDDDFAGLGAGQASPAVPGAHATTVERVTTHALGGAVSRLGASNGGIAGGTSVGGVLGGPLGAVGNSTRGIGDTVRGALAQFPLTAPAGGR